jgi:hypothetical protein
MESKIDLSGNEDPTERMVEQQENARERAEDDENLRDSDHDGQVKTEQFDVQEALSEL